MNLAGLSLEALLARSERVHDREVLEAALARMGAALTRELADERALVLTVMNGGLFCAAALTLRVRADIEFDYVHATRYGDATVGTEIHWRHRPTTPLAGRVVLLIDDILDEGYTLKALRDYCLAEGARRVLVAVLCVKRHHRRVPGIAADFFGVEVPDRYVFGYGLDCAGRGRNLPAIYALREEDGGHG
jgi:hypoxanthine phosphoribosyltransferase